MSYLCAVIFGGLPKDVFDKTITYESQLEQVLHHQHGAVCPHRCPGQLGAHGEIRLAKLSDKITTRFRELAFWQPRVADSLLIGTLHIERRRAN